MAKEARRSGSGSTGIVQPDILLAEQLYSEPRGSVAARGERELLVAVLEDATHCFKKYHLTTDKRGRSLFAEAEEWIMGSDTGAAFSFPRVCEVLELNPEYIRAGLRKWQEDEIARADGGNRIDRLMEPPDWDPSMGEPLKKASGDS